MLNIDGFLDYLKCEMNRSQMTIDSYAEDLRAFETYFQNLSDSLTWETIDSDIIRNWLEAMMDTGNKASSVGRRLSAVRTFYRYALARHYVDTDPAHSILTPKKEKPLPQFLKQVTPLISICSRCSAGSVSSTATRSWTPIRWQEVPMHSSTVNMKKGSLLFLYWFPVQTHSIWTTLPIASSWVRSRPITWSLMFIAAGSKGFW